MFKLWISLLRQFIFWMLFFAFIRIVFLMYNQRYIYLDNISFGEVMGAFWHGLTVDIASACYILILPALFLFFFGFSGRMWLNKLNKAYTGIVIALYAVITATELGIYPEWKTKLSAKALLYLRNPDEVFLSIPGFRFFTLLGTAVIIFYISFYLYKKYFHKSFQKFHLNVVKSLIFLVITLLLLFTGLRGGFSPIPISPSAAYYSNHNILNLASVNSGFNLAISILENQKFNYRNPFEFLDPEEAMETFARINRVPADTTISILNTQRANVIILLLESWSADLIESLGGKPGITPEFAKLEEGGLLFTRHYATGSRSQQAIASILGGFPATPFTTITENIDKYSKLPSLTRVFNMEGYHTSFYFGGQLTYGNIKAFLYFNEFDVIIEGDDLPDEFPEGRLGVHDEFLFQHHIEEVSKLKEPFFSMVFTMSSHSPYDQPMEKVLDWGGSENEFINSAYYTDHHLGRYFEMAGKQDWYSNTLFIIVADHSHNTYRNWPLGSFEFHKIPLLFYGDVLKEEFRNTRDDRIVNNVFIPKSILNQLNFNSRDFVWSHDLFNPYCPQYAYFELQNAFGWKEPNGEFVYSWDWDNYYRKNFAPELSKTAQDSVIMDGKSFLQVLFQEFIDL